MTLRTPHTPTHAYNNLHSKFQQGVTICSGLPFSGSIRGARWGTPTLVQTASSIASGMHFPSCFPNSLKPNRCWAALSDSTSDMALHCCAVLDRTGIYSRTKHFHTELMTALMHRTNVQPTVASRTPEHLESPRGSIRDRLDALLQGKTRVTI